MHLCKNTSRLPVGVSQFSSLCEGETTNNLCDRVMTTRLGSRNLGHADLAKPPGVCDDIIVRKSVGQQSWRGRSRWG